MNTWSFDNDELFDLVSRGRKTATCSVLDNEPLSKPGDIEQIVNSKGDIIKIQITKVEKLLLKTIKCLLKSKKKRNSYEARKYR